MNNQNVKIFVLLTVIITLSSSTPDTESEVQMIKSALQNNKTIDVEHILRNIAKTAVSPSKCVSIVKYVFLC